MKFSDELWSAVQTTYHQILEHPFIQELIDGSLAQEKFTHFLQQDRLYLKEFANRLITLSQRTSDHKKTLLHFAGVTVAAEQDLQKAFLMDHDLESATTVCEDYIHFLKTTVDSDEFCLGIVALLPCFWIYQKVGNFIYDQTKVNLSTHVYEKWITGYANEQFEQDAETYLSIVNELALQHLEMQPKMLKIFLQAAEWELAFWDSAYQFNCCHSSASWNQS